MTTRRKDALFLELQPLVLAHLRGEVTPDEADHLERLVIEDPEARRLYVELIGDDLNLQVLATELLPDTEKVVNERIFAPATAKSPAVITRIPRKMVSFLRRLAAFIDQTINWRRHPLRFLVSAVAITVVFWIAAATLMLPWGAQERAEKRSQAGEEAPQFVAQLVRSINAKWQNDSSQVFDGAHLQQDQNLNLAEGLAEILFESGTRVIVEGPANFSVNGRNSCRLISGRCVARVPQRAVGFTLKTAYFRVVDLGTEFGINLRGGKIAETDVFEGAVRVTTVGEGGADTGSRVFRVGERAVIHSGRFVESSESITDVKFVRALPQPERLITSARSSSGRRYLVDRRGLREDALGYTDRKHEWNGVDAGGIPAPLLGAEYVRPAMEDKREVKLRVQVTLARSAWVYLMVDDRTETLAWLSEGYQKTTMQIGLDESWPDGRGPKGRGRSVTGAGRGIDSKFTVWKSRQARSGTVVLGPVAPLGRFTMYGIAAIAEAAIDPARDASPEALRADDTKAKPPP